MTKHQVITAMPSPSINEDHLTLDQFKKCLPPRTHGNITKELLDDINNLIDSTPLRESYRDNLLAYTSVLLEGRSSLRQYINAVRYVTFKLMNETNIAAYTKTFPARYQEMINNGWSAKDINSTVSSYSKNSLVVKIFEQSIVPTWILNQDMHQKALNTQADLMVNARSEKVRCDAANSILTHLKRPEASKVELDVTVKEDDSITELRKTTLDLVAQQRKMIQAGIMNAEETARQKIIEGELIE